MLDGIKILVERLNSQENNDTEQFEYLAQEVVRDYGDDVDPFTVEEKASVREALFNYRRKQFTARVLSRVSGAPEQTKWFSDAVVKGEGQMIKPQKLILNRAQVEVARGLIK